MTSGTPGRDSLVEMWAALAGVSPGERLFRTRRLHEPSGLDLRVALRETDGAPCLVAVTDGVDTSAIAAFETGGLRLARSRDASGVLLVLSLEEPARRDLFAQVCSDLLRSVADAGAVAPDEIVRDLAARLSAWRSFLRDQAGGLQRHEIVGLAGELIMLGELLRIDPDALAAWRSPDDGLFDFQRGGWAFEVKCTIGTGARLRISTLDQLDDAGLAELWLVHVRLAEDPDGETLSGLVGRLERSFQVDRGRRDFRNALLRRGLPPDLDETLPPAFRLAGIDCYRVAPEFPRLRRRDVPAGIADASYELEARSLAGFAAPLADATAGMSRHRHV